MNLKLNYQYFLQSHKYYIVKLNTTLRKDKKSNKNNALSLEEVTNMNYELLEKGRLGIPTLPIIIEDSLEKEEDIEIVDVPTKPLEIYDDSKLVSLTFDDGPSKYTDELLNVLKETNSKATFFITGNNVRSNADTIKKIASLGHQIGISGYTHVPFTNLAIDDVNTEIIATNSSLANIGVNPSNVVRPPFGKLNETIKEQIKSPIVLWNIDTEDWKNQNKEFIKNKIRKNISEGSIILMHDSYQSTIDAVKEIIPELQEQGYKFTTVNDMHARYDINLVPGRVYAKVKKEN